MNDIKTLKTRVKSSSQIMLNEPYLFTEVEIIINEMLAWAAEYHKKDVGGAILNNRLQAIAASNITFKELFQEAYYRSLNGDTTWMQVLISSPSAQEFIKLLCKEN